VKKLYKQQAPYISRTGITATCLFQNNNTMKQAKTIFLIDDDPITNYVNKKIIGKSYPFTMVEFTNSSEALAVLKEYSSSQTHLFPEIIFLDINMPHLDGWEFLEEFQKLPKAVLDKCDVVMLSSSIDNYDIERSKKYSIVKRFISKPLTVDKVYGLHQRIDR
jgi:CheY-like chemotaxis protein